MYCVWGRRKSAVGLEENELVEHETFLMSFYWINIDGSVGKILMDFSGDFLLNGSLMESIKISC